MFYSQDENINNIDIYSFREGGSMMSSLGISSYNYNTYDISMYAKLASGKKLLSASDGAAELAISQKQEAQVSGYDAGTNNLKSAQEALNVSDSGLSSISDYLQRIRELAVQASNDATLGTSDKQNLQDEIDQLKQGITDVASNTSYNTKNLLDGSNTNFKLATDSNGNATSFQTPNAMLTTLGMDSFNVTGSFDLKTVDAALEQVNSSRSSIGAQYNAMTYNINHNGYAAYNTLASASRLEDLDYPQAISEKKRQETLQLYSTYMQTNQMQQKRAQMNLMVS